MKNLLKINIYDKKGKFENIVYSNVPKRLYHSYGYSLLPVIYEFEEQSDISNVIEITLPLNEAKKVLEQLGFEYKELKTNAVN